MSLTAIREVVETLDKDPRVPRIEIYISYTLTFDPLKTRIELFPLVWKNLKSQKSGIVNAVSLKLQYVTDKTFIRKNLPNCFEKFNHFHFIAL